MVHPSLQKYMPQIITLLKKHKVTSAYLFGSAVSDRFNEESDVDFLVNFQENLDPLEKGGLFWDLQDALRERLGREVDILSERALKNTYFIQEVNETRVKIYG
ncbi:nucleotidyltransferase family protein [Pedobacter mendelii]|uniref:Nucleotidyltransferase n=1 Tax=Pedobacter mendelii TaxID=1908240 RepID=A0ABQ2BC65_9SPHI|nr:nucleotidyltransferase domain-containing protein [Pedobacter mendelii]GGI22731.1 nucleotidyltransferase [Pedobacter mendelii]